MTPDELKKISEAAKKSSEQARLDKITSRTKQHNDWTEKTYVSVLKRCPETMAEAAAKGRDYVEVYSYDTDQAKYGKFYDYAINEHLNIDAPDRTVCKRLKEELEERQGFKTEFRYYDFKGSDESPTEHLCGLIVTW